MLLPFAIDTYKTGHATITKEVLVSWYRLTPAAACGTGGTTGNTAAQVVQRSTVYHAVHSIPALFRIAKQFAIVLRPAITHCV